jgi:hypothetical protein
MVKTRTVPAAVWQPDGSNPNKAESMVKTHTVPAVWQSDAANPNKAESMVKTRTVLYTSKADLQTTTVLP